MPWINEDIIQQLITRIPEKIRRPIPHTSRPPEKGEPEGENFYFVKPEVLESMEQDGNLIYVDEDATTGHRHGVSWDEVHRLGSQGLMAVVNYPLEGVEAVREKRLNRALCILITRKTKAVRNQQQGIHTFLDSDLFESSANFH